MSNLNIPFAIGELVGIRFMTEAGVVDKICIDQYGITYFLNTCYEPHRRIGSFDVHELYSLENE